MAASNERLVDLKEIVISLIRAGIWAAIFGVSLHLSSPLIAAVPIFLLFVSTKHLSLQVKRLRDENFYLRLTITNYLIANQIRELEQLEQGDSDIENEHEFVTKTTSTGAIEDFAG